MRFFCLLLLFGLAACVFRTPPIYPVDLVQVDSLLNHDPEGAMSQLAHYRTQGLDAPSVAYHRLLYTIAGDKLDSVFHSDSLIEWASQQLTHDPLQYARARFYSGLVRFRKNDEDTLAFRYMKEAHTTCLTHGIENAFLRSMIASFMGRSQFSFCNFEQALVCHQEALKYSRILNDTLFMLYDRAELGRAYTSLKKFEKAEVIYDSLLQESIQSPDLLSNILIGQALLYGLKGDLKMSIDKYRILTDPVFENVRSDVNINYSLSRHYQSLHQMDSAYYFGKKSIEAIRDTFGYYHLVYWRNGCIAFDLDRYRESAVYFKEAYNLHEQFADDISGSRLVEIEKRYDVLSKQVALEKAESKYYFILFILFVALVLVLIGSFILYRKRASRLSQFKEALRREQRSRTAAGALLMMLRFNNELDEYAEALSVKPCVTVTDFQKKMTRQKKMMRKMVVADLFQWLQENELLPYVDQNGHLLTEEEWIMYYFFNEQWDNTQVAQLLFSNQGVVKTKRYQIKLKIEGFLPCIDAVDL